MSIVPAVRDCLYPVLTAAEINVPGTCKMPGTYYCPAEAQPLRWIENKKIILFLRQILL